MNRSWPCPTSRNAAWRLVGQVLLAVGLVALPGASARADDSPLNTTAGYEYFAGPDGQQTQTVTGEVEGKFHRMSATLSAGRAHDVGAGTGWTLGAGLGLPIARRTQLKLNMERTSADSDYVAWKGEAGPAFDLGHDKTLTLTYVRVEDTDHTITNGASAEMEGPIVPDHLSASGTLAYTNTGSLNGVEGTAGLSWTPIDHVEIEGDAGYTQTGFSLNSPFSSKHVAKGSANRQRGKPVAPTAPISESDGTPGMTAQLAVRFSFP
jgi:hypothetical protein